MSKWLIWSILSFVVPLLLVAGTADAQVVPLLNAVNLYANTSLGKAQAWMKQPGLRSDTLFSTACRIFAPAEAVAKSRDLERGGLRPLRLPLFNNGQSADAPVLLNGGSSLSNVFNAVVEVRLGPFRAEKYVDDEAQFTVVDLTSAGSSHALWFDWEDETRRPLRLSIFVADTTATLCLSLALFTSRAAATGGTPTEEPLMTWTESSLGTGCGLELAHAAQTALTLFPPTQTSAGSPLDSCTIGRADEFQYTIDLAEHVAHGDEGCDYTHELDAATSRRYVNCTFFLALSGRAPRLSEDAEREGELLLAATVTQPASTSSSSLHNDAPEAAHASLFSRPVEWLSWIDAAHRCDIARLGPDFWNVDTDACRLRSEQRTQAIRPDHQLQSHWVLLIFFTVAVIFGALMTAVLLLCTRRGVFLSASRR